MIVHDKTYHTALTIIFLVEVTIANYITQPFNWLLLQQIPSL